MREKKFQVFVSSTYEDLKDERQAAVEAILSSSNIPAGMELFTAGDQSQMTVIKRWIDDSDIYLLILGGRYGSIEPVSGKSYVHLEYEYAVEKNKPLFALVIKEQALDEKVKAEGKNVLEIKNDHKYQSFKSLVLTKLVKFWNDAKDIKIAIHETLAEMAYRTEIIGWIRSNNSINAAPVAQEIARLTKENSMLRSKVEQETNPIQYGGLNFNELAEMLQSDIDGNGKSLYDRLFEAADDIIQRNVAFDGDDKKELDKLVKLRILQDESGAASWSQYYFTDMGHNFFIKMLYLKSRQNRNNTA